MRRQPHSIGRAFATTWSSLLKWVSLGTRGRIVLSPDRPEDFVEALTRNRHLRG